MVRWAAEKYASPTERKSFMTKIIAHRGASYLAEHENTIESFQLAIELNADMVEFDVRCTSDKKLVVFHDSTFGDMPISYQTYKQLNLHAEEQGFHIPTFEEVLKLCAGRIFMDIEVKDTGYEKEVVHFLHKYCRYEQYSVKSFFDPVVYKIKRMDQNITTGLLLGKDHPGFVGRMKEVYPVRRLRQSSCDFVSPYWFFASRLFVWRLHRKGYPVYVWTVNRPNVMRKFLKRDIDGIITDKPDMGLSMRKKMYQKKMGNE